MNKFKTTAIALGTIVFFGIVSIAAAVNITVPSAPTSGYFLVSTSTGAYIASSSPYFSNGITVNGTSTLATTTTSVLNGTIVIDGVRYAKTSIGIEAAVSQCGRNGIGNVYLPGGIYTVNGVEIVPVNNCHVYGAGKGITIIQGSNASDWVINYASSIPLINFSVTDLTLDLQNGSNASGIQLLDASSSEVSRVAFLNGAAGGWFLVLGTNNGATDPVTSFSNKFIDDDFTNHAGTLEDFLVFNASSTEIVRPNFTNSSSPMIGLYQNDFGTQISDPYCYNGSNAFIYYSISVNNTTIDNPVAINCGPGIRGANGSDHGLFNQTQAQGLTVNSPVFLGGSNSTQSVGIQLGAVNDATVSNQNVQGYQIGDFISGGNGFIGTSTNWAINGGTIKNNNSSADAYSVHPGILIADHNTGIQNGIITNVQIYDDLHSNQTCPVSFDGPERYDGITIVNNKLAASSTASSICLPDAATLGLAVLIHGNQNFTGTAPSQNDWLASGLNLLYTQGNIGIGTTTPDSLLDVDGVTGSQLVHIGDPTNNSINKLLIENGWSGNDNQALQVQRNATTPQFTITGAGRIGQASSTPDSGTSLNFPSGRAYLHVGDAANVGTTKILVENGWTGTGVYGLVVQRNSTTPQFAVDGTGNVGVGTSTPYALFSIGNTGGIGFTLATSTFNTTGGINLAAGCFAVAGVCISGGSGTNYLPLNNIWTGTNTFNATSTFATTTTSNLNGTAVVDGVRYPQTIAGIQLAVNTNCGVGKNGSVFLPNATYTDGTSLTLPSNCHITGASRDAAIILGNVAAPTILTTPSGTGTGIYADIALSTLTVKNSNSNIAAHVMKLQNINGLVIDNVRIEDVGTLAGPPESMYLQYDTNVRVTNNYMFNVSGDGIQLNAVTHFVVDSNIIASSTDDAIDIDLDFGGTAAIPSQYGVVSNNHITGVTQGNGIRVEDSNYITVNNNQITGVQSGGCIQVNSSNLSMVGIVVSGNQVQNCYNNGILIAGNITGTTVIGNNVSSSTVSSASAYGGIQINAASTTVVGNFVYNTIKTGTDSGAILLYKKSNVQINDNHIYNSDKGIEVWNGSGSEVYKNVEISNNHFYGVTTNYDGATAQAGVSINASGFNAAGNFVGWGIGTTTPGSIFAIGSIANFTVATTTFYSTGGINLTGGGCFAISGVCLTSGTGSSFSYPFPLLGLATTSPIMLLASTTIGNGTAANGLTVSGTATTSNLYVSGKVGVATQIPDTLLSIYGGGDQLDAQFSSAYGGHGGMELSEFYVPAGNRVAAIKFQANTGTAGAVILATANGGSLIEGARLDQTGFFGIGTSTPYAALSVVGSSGVVADHYVGTSTTNASTFASNVGIGTVTPTFDFAGTGLHIYNPGGNANLRVQSGSGAATIQETSSGGAFHFNVSTAGDWSVTESGVADRMIIKKTTGNVGIGQNSPGSLLSVNAGGTFGSAYATLAAPSNGLLSQGSVGIGTSTPFANLSVYANNGDTNKTLFAIGSSTASTITTLFSVDNKGHQYTSGSTPSVSGGTSSVVGNDNNGTITVTGVALTSVTLTFATSWNSAPDCTISDSSTGVTAGVTSISATQMVVAFSIGVNSGTVWYICQGHQ